MGEIEKTVGQLLVSNLGVVAIIVLFILSSIFKIAKKEIDPLGSLVTWIGKKFTKDVRTDIAGLQQETNEKFEEVKRDRIVKINELKSDYNNQIKELREDLDGFEKRTDTSITEMKNGTMKNCAELKKRMDELDAANIRSNDMQTVRQIKAHVLDFANSCMNRRKHTKKDFENIINENTEYEKLVEKYKLVNDVYKEDFEFIMKNYHQCCDENSFLKESDAEAL